ncbi:MAG TPA: hypothetical protein VGE08_00045 [Steroidobacter sp.]
MRVDLDVRARLPEPWPARRSAGVEIRASARLAEHASSRAQDLDTEHGVAN